MDRTGSRQSAAMLPSLENLHISGGGASSARGHIRTGCAVGLGFHPHVTKVNHSVVDIVNRAAAWCILIRSRTQEMEPEEESMTRLVDEAMLTNERARRSSFC